MRFRTTAFPALRDTKRPYRVCPVDPGYVTTTRPCRRWRFPFCRTRLKSAEDRRVSRSGGETLPTLLTPRLENRTACSIVHAVAETVTSLPSAHLGLIRSFHRATRGLAGGSTQVTDAFATMSKLMEGPQGRSNDRETQAAKKPDRSRKESHGTFGSEEGSSDYPETGKIVHIQRIAWG